MPLGSGPINRKLWLVFDEDRVRATHRRSRIFIEVNDVIDGEPAFEYNVWSIDAIQLRSYLFITRWKKKNQ